MMDSKLDDFGPRCRAAFAEPDPAAKVILLREVRKALDDWQQTLENWIAGAPRTNLTD